MWRFEVNSDLKAEPVILGLRVGNIIYLAMIGLIGLVFFGLSGHLGIDKAYIGGVFFVVFAAAYFYLKKVEKNADYGYMDKFIARLSQPKKVDPSDMKSVILKRRSKHEIRRY